ncbi:hypothetical protein CRI94_11165 [Longibacter salinarum]|uniref:DUF3667 domain-containing protein n=1 Tax=Longibacter salinarum TaxID=1850348 RepID=A0A2A8CX78_9BACT|nr:hypothetical protein CRI94_11165 [Longibacter salinarum]
MADELFSFDTRLVRTVRMLVSRPGGLTVAYLGGRRAPYIRPFRLFVVSGLLLLLVTSLGRSLTDTRGVPMLKPVVNVDVSDDEIQKMRAEADSIRAAGTVVTSVKAAFVEGTARAAEDPERINRIFQERLSILAAMLLPAFAGLLQLLFRRRFYAEHVIHALHLHSFLFLATSTYLSVAYFIRLVDATQTASVLLPIAVVALVGTLLVYGFRSLRRVYAEPFRTTAWKGGLLLLLNGIVFLAALLIYLFGTLLMA